MLSDLLSELASDLGIQISIPAERSYLLDKVNKAARELLESSTLRAAQMEQLFEVDTSTQQISLPSYIGRILAIRHHYLRAPINQESLRPRYVQQAWVPPYLNWRIKKQDAALSRITDQAGPLTFTLSAAETEAAFVITVAGRTLDARHRVETLAVPIGTTSVETTNSFYPEHVQYIKKSRATANDITVTDLDGTVVAELYNNRLSTQYMIVNILDWLFVPDTDNNKYVEVLWKPRFVPYVEDTDVFVGGEMYERAIYYKVRQYMYEKQEGKANEAILAMQACNQYALNVDNEMKSDEAQKLRFKMPIMYRFKYLSNFWSYRQSGLN